MIRPLSRSSEAYLVDPFCLCICVSVCCVSVSVCCVFCLCVSMCCVVSLCCVLCVRSELVGARTHCLGGDERVVQCHLSQLRKLTKQRIGECIGVASALTRTALCERRAERVCVRRWGAAVE